MLQHLQSWQGVSVLVLGDVMLDRYWHGDTARISPEAPVPVVRVGHNEDRPGGAANVALNIAALGAKPYLLGLVGEDEAGQVLAQSLDASGVKHDLQCLKNHPTITKLRVLSRHQQLIRLDFEQTLPPDTVDLLERFKRYLPEVQAVVLSDYGKGVLSNPQPFIQAAKQAGVPVLVDPKSRDFHLYQGATIITPNQKEFEVVAGDCATEAEFATKGLQLIDEHDLSALLITRGERGMVLLQPDHEPFSLPAQAREVFDVTGAGDTVIAVLATAVAAGCELPIAVQLANQAASLVVAKLGTATISWQELWQCFDNSAQTLETGVVNEDRLLELRIQARMRGERVVMTNGCFDILHPGHVTYLQQAKALGDRLIIAVNTDASVRALKGNDRPINSLEARMHVLAGLGAVDWVVPFSEETPERLIRRILPDVLVKGGDYTIDAIAGAKAVQQNGGDVRVLSFVDGYSTSKMIEKILTSDDVKVD